MIKNVTQEVVGGLKAQPLALALIVVNVLFLAMVIWLFHGIGVARHEDREAQNKLLDRVTQAALECQRTNGRFRLQSDDTVPMPPPRPAEGIPR